MSFDGSGTYSLTYSFATEAASPPIAISKLDTEFSGIATALSTCILRDGTGKPTANIDWNAKKITNLADATAATDALNRQTADARYAQLGGATFTGAVSGTSASFSTTLAATGASTFGSTVGVAGDFAINTNKFTVTAASGNTAIAGTLAVTGAVTLSSTLSVGAVTGTSFAGAVAATTLSASSTVSGAGFTSYLASPPAIGTTTPAGGRFTFAHTAEVAVTFNATTMAVNCSLSNVFGVTFTANVTAWPNFSNPKDGQVVNIYITQDGTGSRTVTWPTNFIWPGGAVGVLSTTAGSVDLLVASYRSATSKWHATLHKGWS